MSNDLRTRIAAVLNAQLKNQADERNGWHESWDSSSLADVEIDDLDLNALADALIRELGLRIEKGQRSKPDGPLWGSDNRYTVHRYVTEWEADD